VLSIIICSRTQTISPILAKNIKNTIGSRYELIVIDNSGSQYSIFEAYNKGIEKSTAKYLCFFHDDILFHTENWGNILINLFRDNPEFGLFGIAGSEIKTKIPSGWWDCDQKYNALNIIQHFPNGGFEEQNIGFKSRNLHQVVVVDGVFLGLKREIGVSFNEDLLGFHGYDLNISFEVLKTGNKIGVTNSILIEHFSLGNLNFAWLKSVIQVHKLYKKSLPLYINKVDLINSEIFNCEKLVDKCMELREKKWFFYYWFKLFFLKPTSRMHLKIIKKIIIYIK
jgi:glycosyltransferase involved in cell wall biosynthesis